jgi:hypothetical protein
MERNNMKTQNTAKMILAGAAMAGLVSGAAVRAHATTSSPSPSLGAGQIADDSSSGKHGCKGQNSCKGQGGCKTSDNGCKAKNSCKGKGGCATDGSKSNS